MKTNLELDIANLTSELELILELLRNEDPNQIKTELYSLIDWDLFIDLAKHHRVYPVLYGKLNAIKSDFVPCAVIDKFSHLYKRNAFQMLALSGEMERISRIFAEEDISLIFLKGPVLAHDLYGDISLRTSSDLDMLVSIDQLERAEMLLQQQGYEKDDYIQSVLNDWKWRHHHVTYYHPQKHMKLEIHWRLNPGPVKEPSFRDLWQRKRNSNLTTTPIYILGKEDLFLFLVSHGARHGWSRLRWLVDVQQLTGKEVNWEVIQSYLKKYYYHRVAGQVLILASELLQVKLNRHMKQIADHKCARQLAQASVFYLESMINLHTDPVPEKVSHYHRRYLFSLMSTHQKFFFILSFLYPYPEDQQTLPLPKQLHFLYFPLRPILWIWRKT